MLQSPGEGVYFDGGCQREQIGPTAPSKKKKKKEKCRLVGKHKDRQDYSWELPGLQSQEKTEMCNDINDGNG